MLTLLLIACQPDLSPSTHGASDSDAAADTATDTGAQDLGEPITATPGTWTWVDVPGSTCDDGTQTGIGVNIGTSNSLIVFFEGGGACWDATTCLVYNTSSHGPYGAAEFDASGDHSIGLFRRDDEENPFRDWTMVWVPYCTGDLHTGDVVTSYDAGDGPTDYYHTGHRNVLAHLQRLAATFASPTQVAVTGTSSGGAGTLLNYADYRRTWPDARMYLVDDSAPLLVGDAMPPSLRSAWESAWALQPLLAEICGDASCDDDLSRVHTALASQFPGDRMALLSSLQDRVFSSYVGLSGDAYQTQLELLRTDVLEPSGTWQPYFVEGDDHSLLLGGDSVQSNGLPLQTWLTQMVTDDDAWTATY